MPLFSALESGRLKRLQRAVPRNRKVTLLDVSSETELGEASSVQVSSAKLSRKAVPRVAEFFAGIGLVRKALEQEGLRVVFANDIDPSKRSLYAANFDSSDFVLGDVRSIAGCNIPEIELATASFPCTDLSLAGNRTGLIGEQSGMFWEFARIIGEMGPRKPAMVLLENVIGFATSNNGEDMAAAIGRLNSLGYTCDIIVLDASFFVPQSRPRMFVIGALGPVSFKMDWSESCLRPGWVWNFIQSYSGLKFHAKHLPLPDRSTRTLADYVERLHYSDSRWWDNSRQSRFVASLSPLQGKRLALLKNAPRLNWATAYRRTRNGKAVWEVRADSISGCLRTARGGSSKQAVVEAGRGSVRVRWMTAREYARLQGAPDFDFSAVRENAAMYGFGDAVCVPVVAWIARYYLLPALAESERRSVGVS